jgi:gliding motility-associatede transport system auxiliary component
MIQKVLNIVGWIGMGMVLVAVAIRFGMPAKEQYAYYLAWGGLVAVLLYTIGQWREIATAFSGRQARYGALTSVSVLVVLGILVAINYIGKKQNKRWDLTANKQFALADQSRNVLAKLDAPLQVQVFAKEQDFPTFQDKLKEYTYASNKISAEYIDPDKKPNVAKQAGIQAYNTLVFNYKGRSERVTSDSEQDITNGIIKVVSGQQRKLYFTQGHGEKDTAGTDRDSYTGISQALGRENYAVDKVVLAQQGAVPDDATVLIIAGPRADFFPAEIDALKKYLDKAGKVFLMLDPPDKTDSAQLTNLIGLAHDWGVDVGNNVVVDVSGATNEPSIAVAATYPEHAITQNFATLTIYPIARSIDPAMGASHTPTAIVQTSRESWAESDLGSLTGGAGVALNEDKGDKRGPISLAAAVSAPVEAAAGAATNADQQKPETRVVVFGDSDFASNAYAGVPGNQNLFANAISWLAQQEGLIAVRPTQADDRRVSMTPREQTLATLTSIFILPGVVFLAGVYPWWRRR